MPHLDMTPTLRQESPQPAYVSRITVPEPVAPTSGSVSRQLGDEGVPGGLQSVPVRRTSDEQKVGRHCLVLRLVHRGRICINMKLLQVEQLRAFAVRLAPWKTQIDRKLEVGTVDPKVLHSKDNYREK